ncbi:OmpA family protein [Cognatishimia sp. MH4019]|uniref:OmpA family protein n=1 Tax=Cognatishimia sp. MH4019 TaxID=2854030 RepID=UPI001CD22E57|nr:OmpA family protein [Cognatishimia sp. MH4019]
MRLSSALILVATFGAAGLGAFLAASTGATFIEQRSEIDVRFALDENQLSWAEVQSNGLRVELTGTAPDEAQRFRAISTAGRIVDAARVIDRMQVEDMAALAAPRFSVEILRNESGISLIGLIPTEINREDISQAITELAPDTPVTDLLESADYPTPDGFDVALSFSFDALAQLPRSKISVSEDGVEITAISESTEDKRRLETDIARAKPNDVRLAMEISAPRPVITPFTARFLIDADGARFDTCSADNEPSRDRILAAARAAGLEGQIDCVLGLGVPTPQWGNGVALGIESLTELGGGSITFADADVTLAALEGTDEGLFDRVAGELNTALPEVFSLTAVLPKSDANNGDGPPEFIATLSPEGQVQLRGRLPSDLVRGVTENFAQARFGIDKVYVATRNVDNLPDGWPVRVLAALEALSELANGAVIVQPDLVTVRGDTGNVDARAAISRLLSDKLGEGARFEIFVTYKEALDPIASLPTVDECVGDIKRIGTEQKITFEPSSAVVDASARPTLDAISAVFEECDVLDFEIEIGGHTDSQGSEEGNQRISEQRAQAVLEQLLQRGVSTLKLTAVGYGETSPIADNETEEGRESNRRIEFKRVFLAPNREEAPSDATETEETEATDE